MIKLPKGTAPLLWVVENNVIWRARFCSCTSGHLWDLQNLPSYEELEFIARAVAKKRERLHREREGHLITL
jgi:hypothetical protein